VDLVEKQGVGKFSNQRLDYRMSWTDEQLESFEINRRSWDERVDTHWSSDMYQRHADSLRKGSPAIHAGLLEDAGDVSGLSLVHLQCHMGMETMSWSMLGANATGLDYSQPAIDKAELLRDELKLDTQFACANVYDAAEVIQQTFDMAFVSVGAINWLPDLERWATVVANLLKPGGRLLMNEVHPFANVFDDEENNVEGIGVKFPYLDAQPVISECAGTYADLESKHENTQSVEYSHTLATIFNSLIQEGLRIDRFVESDDCMWPRFRAMEQVGPDSWALPDPVVQKLPHTFTLIASKAE